MNLEYQKPYFCLSDIDINKNQVFVTRGEDRQKFNVSDLFPDDTIAELTTTLARYLQESLNSEYLSRVRVYFENGSGIPISVYVPPGADGEDKIIKRIKTLLHVKKEYSDIQGGKKRGFNVEFLGATSGADSVLGQRLKTFSEEFAKQEAMRSLQIDLDPSGYSARFSEPVSYVDLAAAIKLAEGSKSPVARRK